MNMKYLKYLAIISLLFSCKQSDDKKCKGFTSNVYSVEVKFNNIFECRDFERIILTAGYPKYRKIDIDKLYKIKTDHNDCAKQDTIVINLNKSQRDSLYDFAYHFIENLKLNIHHEACESIVVKSIQTDPVYAVVEICESKQCKSVEFDVTNAEEDHKKDFAALMNFIDKKK